MEVTQLVQTYKNSQNNTERYDAQIKIKKQLENLKINQSKQIKIQTWEETLQQLSETNHLIIKL